MTFDWFWLLPLLVIAAVIAFVWKSVRKVKEKIERKLGPAPSELAMKQLLDKIKNNELPKCPKCQSESFAMIDTEANYKCESCHFEFEGAPHI